MGGDDIDNLAERWEEGKNPEAGRGVDAGGGGEEEEEDERLL